LQMVRFAGPNHGKNNIEKSSQIKETG
jgi:hypothetical protein